MVDQQSQPKRIEFRAPSDPAYLSVIRQLTWAVSTLAGLSPDAADAFTLGVDEACTNVIKHAYHGDTSKQMILCFELLPDRLLLRLRDFGTQCDPSELKGRDLDEIRPGGLGLHIMRGVTHQIEYDTHQSSGTELRMTRFLSTDTRT